MPQRDQAGLAMEAAAVFALKDRVVEHQRRADEVDAVSRHVLLAARFFPLEHQQSYATKPGWVIRRR
jgi:hypothetical protein